MNLKKNPTKLEYNNGLYNFNFILNDTENKQGYKTLKWLRKNCQYFTTVLWNTKMF